LSFPEIINSTNLNIYAGDLLHDSAIKTLQEYEYKFQEQEKEINFIEISRKNIPISGTQIREKFLTSGAQSIKNDLPYEVFEYLQGD
jgi:citrate lyase synthetase